MRRHARLALRALVRTPVTSAAVVITLALGIGVTTTIFGVVNAAMLVPLPWTGSDRLMDLSLTVASDDAPEPRTLVWSYPKYETMRTLQRSYEAVAAYSTQEVLLGGADGTERVRLEFVSGEYFPLLRAPMAIGRALQPSDDRDGAAPAAVLSHALWMRRFGGDSAIVGREIAVERGRMKVVGVAAESFASLSGEVQLWIPMSIAPTLTYPELLTERWNHFFDVIGRLRDGVTPASAMQEMVTLGRVIDAAHPSPERGSHDTWGAAAKSLREARRDPTMSRAVLILFGAVLCVMLIACVNVANLLLARAAGRTREFAVRVAIGAQRAQVLRELLTETVLLALVGGVLGVLVAAWSVDVVRTLLPATGEGMRTQMAQFLDLSQVHLDQRVLAFGLGLSLLTGVLCGLVPALRASNPMLSDALKDGAGASAEGALTFRRGQARALLVTGNVALSLLLLVGAGLLVRSFEKARGVDAGFDPRNVLTFRVQPPDDSLYGGARAAIFRQELMSRLAALPGVSTVGTDGCAPLSQGCGGTIVLSIDGTTLPVSGARPDIGVHLVNDAYVQAIGARLVAGRFVDESDRWDAPKVAVINETAARRLFPNSDAVGKRLGIGFSNWADAEIVGVISDVNYGQVGAPPALTFYGAYSQASQASGMYFLRTAGEPSALLASARQAVRNMSPQLAVYDEHTLEQRVASSLGRLRFGAVLLGSFAGLGLLLSLIGIYGVLSYTVVHRKREMGIRMALGAVPHEVIRLVMRRAMFLTSIGVTVGLATAWGASRLLRNLVFGVTSTDPATFAIQTLVLVSACALASYLPARRAARLDPVQALRGD
ncbi:MAG: ABC transporter permease [Gemmatimonadota bacterium]